MYSEVIDRVTIRPLRNGETAIVQAVFDRLGDRSRHLRFGGAKNVLTARDLESLARVEAGHEELLPLIECEPVGTPRLVREGATAEVAVEVADCWQGRRVGTILMDRLAADSRAAGIERLHAYVAPENTAARALMRHAAVRVSIA